MDLWFLTGLLMLSQTGTVSPPQGKKKEKKKNSAGILRSHSRSPFYFSDFPLSLLRHFSGSCWSSIFRPCDLPHYASSPAERSRGNRRCLWTTGTPTDPARCCCNAGISWGKPKGTNVCPWKRPSSIRGLSRMFLLPFFLSTPLKTDWISWWDFPYQRPLFTCKSSSQLWVF